jgi:hypothetical protein
MPGHIRRVPHRGGSVLCAPARGSKSPIHEPRVQSELTRYLEEQWMPVIERDVEGEHSLPLALDRDNAATLGRFSAARRVARTIYIGSAPTANATTRGVDDRSIKLGCVVPGESPAVFGDALRRLSDRSTLLLRQRRPLLVQHPAVGESPGE